MFPSPSIDTHTLFRKLKSYETTKHKDETYSAKKIRKTKSQKKTFKKIKTNKKLLSPLHPQKPPTYRQKLFRFSADAI